MVLLLGLLSSATGAELSECEDLHTLVVSAEQSLLFGDVTTCQEHLVRIEERFQCGTTPDVSTLHSDLGTYALLQGYLAHLEQDVEQRQFWLQQSVNLNFWSPNFGPEVQSLRDVLAVETDVVVATLPTVLNDSVEIWTDGQQQSLPLSIKPGLHWIWLTQQGETIWQKVIVVQPGDSLVFPSHLEGEVNREHRSLSPMLASGVFLGSLTVVGHIMATWQHNRIPYSDSMTELNQHYRQAQIFGWTSVGTLAGTVLSVWHWRRTRPSDGAEPS